MRACFCEPGVGNFTSDFNLLDRATGCEYSEPADTQDTSDTFLTPTFGREMLKSKGCIPMDISELGMNLVSLASTKYAALILLRALVRYWYWLVYWPVFGCMPHLAIATIKALAFVTTVL